MTEIRSTMLGQLIPCGGGDAIPLTGGKLLIGRRSSCDITLDFQNVSSHHCELELKDGYWQIRDLGSSNGIKVNGERCVAKVLSPGDEVQIARHCFRIEYEVTGDAAPPEDENPFARSLMEKAGLEVDRSSRLKMPKASRTSTSGVKQSRRLSGEDEFIMDWLEEE
jgi:pSer/pThr/pTyr-binding forkhead associated (FHA) protein